MRVSWSREEVDRGEARTTDGMLEDTLVAAWVALELSDEYSDDSLDPSPGGVGVSMGGVEGILVRRGRDGGGCWAPCSNDPTGRCRPGSVLSRSTLPPLFGRDTEPEDDVATLKRDGGLSETTTTQRG